MVWLHAVGDGTSQHFYLKKKKLLGYSMSVLLPEAVQILVKNKFEITDEEVSLLQLSCMLNVYMIF